jgi:hypothetical protein
VTASSRFIGNSALVLLAITLSLCGSDSVQAALLVNGYDADMNDRFNNSSSFIGAPYDWSGVGRNSGGQWATLISDSYFVTASHFAPPNASVIRFYKTNDTSGDYAEQTVITKNGIAGSDLSLGQLTAPVFSGTPFEIAHYPILTLPGLSDFVGLGLQIVGRDADPPALDSMRLGTNEITGTQAAFSDSALSGTGDMFYYDYDTSIANEAKVAGGDSGAPSFVVVDGQLALVGVHWFVYSGAATDPSTGSGDTLVSSYVDDLNQAMSGGESVITVTPTPEPGSFIILVLGLGLLGCGRRQRCQTAVA